MFGYVKPFVPELKVKENEFYRATYCGFCKTLGRKSRFLSFTLSYDFVFLAIVDMAVTPGLKVELGKQRCIAHPLRKRAYLKNNQSLDRTANAAALLLYYNLLDDINDKKGIKRQAAKLAFKKASRIRKKHLSDGRLDAVIAEKLSKLSKVEKESGASIYVSADIFGELLGSVFREAGTGDENSPQKRCLYTLGRYIGRWIYMIDALDDLESDRKSGSYNAFIDSGDAGDPGFGERIRHALIFELSEAEKALDLIDIPDPGLRDIIYNTIKLGMPEVADRVIAGEYNRKKPKHKKSKGDKDGEGSL